MTSIICAFKFWIVEIVFWDLWSSIKWNLEKEILYGFTLVETTQGPYAMGGREVGLNERSEVIQLECPGDRSKAANGKKMKRNWKLQFNSSPRILWNLQLKNKIFLKLAGSSSIYYLESGLWILNFYANKLRNRAIFPDQRKTKTKVALLR